MSVLRTVQSPQFTGSVSDPSPIVHAGWAATETVTVTAVGGFSGDVGVFLSGVPDVNGQPTMPPPGFKGAGGAWGSLNVPANGSATTGPLSIGVQGDVAPGQYGLSIALKGDPMVFLPVQVTVTAAAPLAHAHITADSNATVSSVTDLVNATDTFAGLLRWGVGVDDRDPLPVPGVTIHLPSGPAGFQPPVQYPLDAGPQDVTGMKGPESLWLPFNSAIPDPGLQVGADVERSVAGGSWFIVQGNTQYVTVTITPQTGYQDLILKMAAGDWYAQPYGTFGQASTAGANGQQYLESKGDQLVWEIYQPAGGTTYTLNVPITADVTGTFKPALYVSGITAQSSASQAAQAGQPVTYTDPYLSDGTLGPVTWTATADTFWWIDATHSVGVRFDGLSPAPAPPPAEVTVQSWATTSQGLPVVFDRGMSTITRDTAGDCVGNQPVKEVQLTLHPAEGNDINATLSHAGPGAVWSAPVDMTGSHGYATLTFDVTCSNNTVEPKDGGSIFIDPSGTVVNACTHAPLAGATVTLQTEAVTGKFDPPLAGSFVPAVNPEVTGAGGLYGWEVLEGLWRVHVQASGYTPADSTVLMVPPAVTDLTIALMPVGGCDTTPPSASPSASPGPNGNGWNNTGVTVTWNWADSGSVIDSSSCTASSTSSGEGTITLSASCTDHAGNTGTASSVVKVDKTPPSLAPSVSPDPVALNGSATASPNASDGLSGVASASCRPVDTSTIGAFTVTCTATDKAGNTRTATARYTVSVRATKAAVLAQVNAALATAGRHDAAGLREAARQLARSLDPANWVDGNHLVVRRGSGVFDDEQAAVDSLRDLLRDHRGGVADATLQGWIDTLVTVDRALARIAIDEAGLSGREATAARRELARGDAAGARHQPAQAIQDYKQAWQIAYRGHGGDDRNADDRQDDNR